MTKSEFELAVTQLAAERGLPKEKVVAAVEAALASAYRKESQAAGQNIMVRLNPQAGFKIFMVKTVADKVEDPHKQILLADATRIKPDAKLGEEIEIEVNNPTSARIAALTAKQVVLQRLREAERDLIYADFLNREGEMLPGRVDRAEPGRLVISLGRAEGYLPKEEQVLTERYRPGVTMQFLLLEIHRGTKGIELILSRSHKNLLKRLLEREVPEIYHGVVEVKAIAREPGSRSKVAVAARQDGVDPVGSCIGPRGVRIQNVVNELQGEKIDIFQWSKELKVFIANALGPAQVQKVELNEDDKIAVAVVPDAQQSLAIGREGQTARLAAKLTGWRIDVRSVTEYEAAQATKLAPVAVAEPIGTELPVEVQLPAPEPEPVRAAVQAPVQPVAAAPAKAEAPAKPEELVTPPPPSDEEVWKLGRFFRPQAPAPGLRFAEDVLPGRGKSRATPETTEEQAKSKQPKRARRVRPVEDEDEGDEVPQ
ncbi:MAG: transcription termination/antitermination protein NusA [Dehalococcoidia bacterium]|nr:transcription termination/antitermination protein NusA [Dehalococcoidia bacterium]